ncbi:MAG TPA: energy transducer TonB [Flavobacterium sp.]|jgi:outer membrane biosynthesis protein TonB|nr:energy transducer TonB [Flavobacterium sp.]
MKYLETEYEKKSFAITTAIMVILLLLFVFLGLTYMDPPPENGIAVNFGNTEFGSGENKTSTETVQSAPQPTSSTSQTASATDELTTQDIEDAPVIKETKKPTPKKETLEPTKEPEKPKPVAKPQPSKSTTDALSNLLNGPKSDGKSKEGEGPDNLPGNKGRIDGDPYANSYYGSGKGSGGGTSGWGLNGRKLSSSGKETQKCNEEGTVVVQIKVNRNGNVVDAKYTTGTTNTNPCLIDPALATAKKHKWKPDPNAPETQVGFIIVNFKLGE